MRLLEQRQFLIDNLGVGTLELLQAQLLISLIHEDLRQTLSWYYSNQEREDNTRRYYIFSSEHRQEFYIGSTQERLKVRFFGYKLTEAAGVLIRAPDVTI